MAIKQRQKGKPDRKPDMAAKVNALPNTFKFAAETIKTMSERGGSAGSIVVSKYKSYNYKLIFALVMNTIKNIKIIKKIIHETKLQKKVPENNPFMLEILVGDLLYGRGLKSVEQNSIAAAVIGLKDVILKQQNLLKKDYKAETPDVEVKYLRVNHLKTSLEHVLSQLKTAGLVQVEYSKEKIKFKKFVNKFKTMDDNSFMLDFHFPNDLIALKPQAMRKLKSSDLMKKCKVMVQDKASLMAVEALDVKPGQKIIDACCAPGGKTSLIASKLKNKGKILAYDVNKKRLLSAIHLLKTYGATCAKTEVQDFSKVKLARLLKANNIDLFDSILIDPSCSGSGITTRVDYKASSEEVGRLKKLQAFQVSLLRHALKAKVSRSIVYCTCSSSVEENEQVLEMALNESNVRTDWQVDEVLPFWPLRGNSDFEFGTKCIRSDPTCLTNGFFIARLSLAQDSEASAESKPGVNNKKKVKFSEDKEAAEGDNETDAELDQEDDDDEIEDEVGSDEDSNQEDEEGTDNGDGMDSDDDELEPDSDVDTEEFSGSDDS